MNCGGYSTVRPRNSTHYWPMHSSLKLTPNQFLTQVVIPTTLVVVTQFRIFATSKYVRCVSASADPDLLTAVQKLRPPSAPRQAGFRSGCSSVALRRKSNFQLASKLLPIFAGRGVAIPNQPQAWHVHVTPTQRKPKIVTSMLR